MIYYNIFNDYALDLGFLKIKTIIITNRLTTIDSYAFSLIIDPTTINSGLNSSKIIPMPIASANLFINVFKRVISSLLLFYFIIQKRNNPIIYFILYTVFFAKLKDKSIIKTINSIIKKMVICIYY